MLTRLKVTGFKNLVDVDVRFGPFTCIAGVNAVGKSNLFDAIQFLSALASKPLTEAAASVREGHRSVDVRGLFHHVGEKYAPRMSFEVEMIVPQQGRDDLGQPARASITFLRYSLELSYRQEDPASEGGPLKIEREELRHIKLGDAPKDLLFPHKAGRWRRKVVTGTRRAPHFISTGTQGGHRIIKLHQDGGSRGKPVSRVAANLPRTVLSAVNAAESPTALLARTEMQSWRLLHLEPAALREPDEFTSPPHLEADGSHLPAALYHLAHKNGHLRGKSRKEPNDPKRIYQAVANRLSELIDDVRTVSVDRDEKRELLTLNIADRQNTPLPARALSDGTLRFLALAVLELEITPQGLLCLEEPENGIHPARIPAMLRLLQDIAVNPEEDAGPDNPLRQVIVNTHSPVVVSNVPDDSLLLAEIKEVATEEGRQNSLSFSCLPDTWRAKAPEKPTAISRGNLLAYLNPVGITDEYPSSAGTSKQKTRRARVADREDMQQLILFPGSAA